MSVQKVRPRQEQQAMGRSAKLDKATQKKVRKEAAERG